MASRAPVHPVSTEVHRQNENGTKFLGLASAIAQNAIGARLTGLGYYRSMASRTELDDEIATAEQRETFKQMLLRLLGDPQIRQKFGAFPTTPQNRCGDHY